MSIRCHLQFDILLHVNAYLIYVIYQKELHIKGKLLSRIILYIDKYSYYSSIFYFKLNFCLFEA